MVKILNGEVVADNDPRLQQRNNNNNTSGGSSGGRIGGIHQQQQQQQQRNAGRQGQTGAMGMGMGGDFFGMRPVEVFGVTIEPQLIVGLCLLGYLWGLKGFLGGAALLYFYKKSQQDGGAGFQMPNLGGVGLGGGSAPPPQGSQGGSRGSGSGSGSSWGSGQRLGRG